MSHPASLSPSLNLHCQMKKKFTLTSSQLIVIPRLPSSVFVLVLPSAFFFFFSPSIACVLSSVDVIIWAFVFVWQVSRAFYLRYFHSIFTTQTHTHPHRQTHTHTHALHNVSSPLQRDVLLIGLSPVTVWEDDLSRRFLCRVVTGTSMSRE